MKRGLPRLKTTPRKKGKFSPENFIKISGLTSLANSIACDQCSKLVRGEQMFANEEHAIDLCKSCFQQNTQEIPEGKVKNGYYCCWEGDTVSRISRQVNVNVSKIVSMNDHIPDLNGRTSLEAGTILKVADGKLKIGVMKEDHEVEDKSRTADKENTVHQDTQMTESEKTKRRARLRDVLDNLCSEKYHPLEEINSYYKELNYCCKDNDRAVKIWVLRAKIREELGDVTSYLKSFLGGNKYNVYWDAAEKGDKLWYTCFLINLNFFNGNAELMWEKEDDIIEYNLKHLWLKSVKETDEEQPTV